MKALWLVLLLPLALFLAHCGSSGSSNNTPTYSYYNGLCYQNSTMTVVSNTNCASQNGFTLTNGVCYNSSGQTVAVQNCTGSTTSNNCVGNYYYCPYGLGAGLAGCQYGYCNGTNCQGYYYTTNGTAVLCQAL